MKLNLSLLEAIEASAYPISLSISELKQFLAIKEPEDWKPQDDMILELADLIRAERKLTGMLEG
jgi:hypothetical protein